MQAFEECAGRLLASEERANELQCALDELQRRASDPPHKPAQAFDEYRTANIGWASAQDELADLKVKYASAVQAFEEYRSVSKGWAAAADELENIKQTLSVSVSPVGSPVIDLRASELQHATMQLWHQEREDLLTQLETLRETNDQALERIRVLQGGDMDDAEEAMEIMRLEHQAAADEWASERRDLVSRDSGAQLAELTQLKELTLQRQAELEELKRHHDATALEWESARRRLEGEVAGLQEVN